MKKWLVLALCVILLIAAAVPALAAEQPKVTITASKTVVARGEEVTFTISMTGDVPFTSAAIDLKDAFSSDYFEYVDKPIDTGAPQGNPMIDPCDFKNNKKEIMLFFMSGTGTCNGVIQKLTFRVKETAPIQSTTVTGTASGNNGSLAIAFAGVKISVECEHTYPNGWVKLDNQYCQRVCSKCNTPDKREHDWKSVAIDPKPSCTGTGTEKFECQVCHATKTADVKATGHAWTNDCDTTCNNGCGETRSASHNYKTTYSSDATNHWYECTGCGDKKDTAAHTPGPAATEKAAQTCTTCGYEIAPALAHEHEMSTEWIKDSEYHWYRCVKSGCYYTEAKAKHVYDDACDVDCNTCGYIRVAPHNYNPEWQADFRGHWHICGSCNTKSEVFPHVPGPEATQDTPQLCEECNFRIKMPLSHVHDFGETWYSDEETHWQSCNDCSEPAEIKPHEWDAGVEQTDGKILYTCGVCGKESLLEEPMPTEPSTQPSTPASSIGTAPPTEPADADRFPWEWAGLAAVVLLVIGIILLVLEFIRSRKINSHGKFSK